MFSHLIVAVSAGLLAVAQQTVQVGPGGSFTFDPTSITAQPGETIMFQMGSPIHTVTQSESLTNPCAATGFTSNVGDSMFSITVNDTKPILINCQVHCSFGMVMIINPASPDDVTTMANAAQGITSPSSGSSGSSSGAPASGGSSSSAGSTVGPASSSTPISGSGSPAGSNPPAQTGTNNAPAGAAPSLLGGFAALFLASFL